MNFLPFSLPLNAPWPSRRCKNRDFLLPLEPGITVWKSIPQLSCFLRNLSRRLCNASRAASLLVAIVSPATAPCYTHTISFLGGGWTWRLPQFCMTQINFCCSRETCTAFGGYRVKAGDRNVHACACLSASLCAGVSAC